MRSIKILLLATSFLSAAAHAGADKPVIAPASDWVKPVALPSVPEKADEAPLRILLADQQTRMEAGRLTSYAHVAMQVQTPQGLSAGNLSFPWNPQTDTLTVHKLVIHRDGKDIDVLASQTFTVVRREPNLENATLDGVLTANIQPEGLQVGDVLEYALTVSSSDPVLKGHVEETGANWNVLPFTRTHFSVQWPSSLPVTIRQSGDLPALKPVKSGPTTSVELSMDNVAPVIPPRGAPARYAMGRIAEFSDFKGWADLGALMAPLYVEAAAVPAQGPLRDELEKIKAASADPVKRTEAALALVQDRVRYVALLMGTGGYVPAKAEETWARRYGDCKAKTALLLALLHELGIEAEPVAANAINGDGIDQRLPMVGLFNHVLVRAHIAGRAYWLDGTRTGDTSIARLRTPDFGWGLPLVAKNAALVRMVPDPLDRPDSDLAIDIDAHEGLTVPAPFKAQMILRGDDAIGAKLSLGSLTADARDRSLRDYWRDQFNFIDVAKVDAAYDAAAGEERMTVEGVAHMEWKDGWYETDKTGVGFDADFLRTAGPGQDAPFAVNFPTYAHMVETIKLPPGFPEGTDIKNAAVNETVAGIEYHRSAQLVDSVFRIERSARTVAPEFAAKDAPAAQKRLRELNDDSVYLKRPDNYKMPPEELKLALEQTPKTAQELLDRGHQLMEAGRNAEAIKDYDAAAANAPKNVWVFANRGLAKVYTGDLKGAGTDLDAAEAIDANNFVIWNARGLLAEAQGENQAALTAYDRAIAISPANDWALARRANVQFQLGNYDAVLKDATAGLALSPGQSNFYLLRANVFRRQGKVDQGLAEARSLADAMPRNSYAQIVAARIYDSFGRKDQALASYDRALAIKPEPYIYLNRVSAHAPDDFAAREADIDAALKLAPDLPDALFAKAELELKRGDFDSAIAVYTAQLQKRPSDPTLLNSRGVAYARAGKTGLADQDFALALKAADNPGLLNNLCWTKLTWGVAYDEALKECDAALAKAPDSPMILDSRAYALLRLGRYDEAIAEFDKALNKAPSQSSSLYGRAVAWARKGEKDKSATDLAAAVAADPGVRDRFIGYGITL